MGGVVTGALVAGILVAGVLVSGTALLDGGVTLLEDGVLPAGSVLLS